MRSDQFVASLDVVVSLLDDPKWSERAKKVNTLRELRQILLDFCKANGQIMRVDKDTIYAYK